MPPKATLLTINPVFPNLVFSIFSLHVVYYGIVTYWSENWNSPKFTKFPLDKKPKKCKIVILAENVGKYYFMEETMNIRLIIFTPPPPPNKLPD
jgi:hypothetical protein